MGRSRNKYRQLAGLDKRTRLLLVTGILKNRPSDCPLPEKNIGRRRKRRRAKGSVTKLAVSAKRRNLQKDDDETIQEKSIVASNDKAVENKVSKDSEQPCKVSNEKHVSKESKAKKVFDSVPKEKKSKKSLHNEAKADRTSANEYFENQSSSGRSYANGNSRNESKESSSCLEKNFLRRLNGGYFRWIGETLYKCSGEEAEQLFAKDPECFKAYHVGYRAQVSKWPVNPVVLVAKWLKRKPSSWKVADMGCGDAQLATLVKNKVYSFDFLALNDRVTACNMAKVPLPDCHVQVCLFCLSLMGTNLADYINEAFRILKPRGFLIIIEMLSRFTGIKVFRRAVEKMGFVFNSRVIHHSYFVWLTFAKGQKQQNRCPARLKLNPCPYKRR
ncbi:hypothetical protein M513_06307 [Trichuris suis]|uniref:Ribosomal RNA-processing protein 8 n=1 Tax=Trichuris suis TaxID=68888 RepID=A0A085M6H0_9BILA|nr:hypothetical protein M513_06307 [Trichuris suis]